MEELINQLVKLNLSQAFLKALASAQKLYCKVTIFEERFPMTDSALRYGHDIKSAERLKLFWFEEVAGR